jgi:hypothetical protein
MTMGYRVPTYPLRFGSATSFNEWLRTAGFCPGLYDIRDHIKMFGKPIVRVPVERQVPNEADL